MWFNKNCKSKEYLELKQDLETLKIRMTSLELEFSLIVKKLKIKYKITHKDKEEAEDIKTSVLLPENGMAKETN